MRTTPESRQHLNLKQLLVRKLKEWFGASLEEYSSSGHKLDIFAVTSSGVRIYIEIIWSLSRTQFLSDMNMLQQSDADVKLAVVNPQIIANGSRVRDYEKVVISQRKLKKVIHAYLLDGSKIVQDAEYVDDHLQKIISGLVSEFQSRFGEGNISDEAHASLREHYKNVIERMEDWDYSPIYKGIIVSKSKIDRIHTPNRIPNKSDVAPSNLSKDLEHLREFTHTWTLYTEGRRIRSEINHRTQQISKIVRLSLSKMMGNKGIEFRNWEMEQLLEAFKGIVVTGVQGDLRRGGMSEPFKARVLDDHLPGRTVIEGWNAYTLEGPLSNAEEFAEILNEIRQLSTLQNEVKALNVALDESEKNEKEFLKTLRDDVIESSKNSDYTTPFLCRGVCDDCKHLREFAYREPRRIESADSMATKSDVTPAPRSEISDEFRDCRDAAIAFHKCYLRDLNSLLAKKYESFLEGKKVFPRMFFRARRNRLGSQTLINDLRKIVNKAEKRTDEALRDYVECQYQIDAAIVAHLDIRRFYNSSPFRDQLLGLVDAYSGRLRKMYRGDLQFGRSEVDEFIDHEYIYQLLNSPEEDAVDFLDGFLYEALWTQLNMNYGCFDDELARARNKARLKQKILNKALQRKKPEKSLRYRRIL